MRRVPDLFVMKGFSLGTIDYRDKGESDPAKRAHGLSGTSTTPLICMGLFSSPSSFPVE